MSAEDEHDFAENALRPRGVGMIPKIFSSVPFPEFQYPDEADRVEHLKHRLALIIWNKEICKQPTLREYGPEIFAVDVENDLVVSFRRSFLRGRILVAGALAAEMCRLDRQEQQLVYKGEVLEKWYNTLARWIRRNYKRESNYGIYVGPSASKSVERGEIELAPYLIARDSN